MDRDFKNEVFSSYDPNPVRVCACGEKPALLRSMLDSQTGRTVRMFKCKKCGEQTWSEDTK
jgi:hypothetical protein